MRLPLKITAFRVSRVQSSWKLWRWDYIYLALFDVPATMTVARRPRARWRRKMWHHPTWLGHWKPKGYHDILATEHRVRSHVVLMIDPSRNYNPDPFEDIVS